MGKRSTQKKKAGMPQGTVVHTGQRRLENAKTTVFDYDEDALNRYRPHRLNTFLEHTLHTNTFVVGINFNSF